ncbi:hypothetical protein SteCoe_33288 [Stentor coeruleus]|uniref:Tyrosine-protein kinase ephrin type A/B receptor-like domain-containing protein n=1 Tax=Stentor coeruleus TaxID=5963 RepID=A0A1R2AX58_9CILI|nr:hypothetical protein SteCoe_33288 [Stentor coeruleus]
MLLITLFFMARSQSSSMDKFSKEIHETGIGPEPREYSSIAYSSLLNKIFIFGGFSKSYLDDLWTFDLTSLHWSIIYPNSISPTKRSTASGFISNQYDEFCIYGGKTKGYILNDMWCFNSQYRMWREVYQSFKPPPFESFGYKKFELNGNEYLLIIGNEILEKVAKSYMYDFSENTWNAWIVTFDITSFMIILSVDQKLMINIEVYEDLAIVLAYSSCDINGKLFISNITSSLITKEVDFFTYNQFPDKYFISGCILIDHYLFSQYLSCRYLIIDIFSPEQENWSFIYIYGQVPFRNAPYIALDNSIIYFGGFTFFYSEVFYITNGIQRHMIYPTYVSSITQAEHYISPPNRLAHSMHSIRGKLWLFGGKGQDTLFADTWSYDPVTNIWNLLNTINKSPTARSHFASASGTDIFIIWGGEDDSGLTNDMFIYNVIKNTWTEKISSSLSIPSKRKGACMVFEVPFAYIYGGMDSNKLYGDLWRYDFRDNTYEILYESKDIKCVFCSCNIYEGVFSAAGGGSDSEGNKQTNEFKYDIVNMKTLPGRTDLCFGSEGIYIGFGISALCIGGHIGYRMLIPVLSFRYYDGIGYSSVSQDVVYSAAFAFHNYDIYIHGGGYYLSQTVLFKDLPLPYFGKISIDYIDSFNNLKINCSEGFYFDKTSCKICPPGTYSNSSSPFECLKCPKGCYNPYKGATSIRQCYPCEEGTFNDKYGAKACKICPEGFQCSTGSQKPYDSSTKLSSIQSIQPKIYKTNNSNSWENWFQYAVGITVIAFIILTLKFNRIQQLIMNIDYFTSSHNHEIGEFMQLKKTLIGGIFTIIFFGASIVIIVSVIMVYMTENITEIKTLMPLVILENNVNKFSANIMIKFMLHNYGDLCAQKDMDQTYSSRYCSDNLYITVDNIDTKGESIKCSKDTENSCQVVYQCYKCEISINSAVKLTLSEDSSYSTGITVNVTSDSSIPESSSSVFMSLSPTPGSEPSQFYFSVIPSYFTSTISLFPHELTGYHLSPASTPSQGSENYIEDLSVATQLSVQVNFNKLSTGLYTSRYQGQSALIFISGLFGTLSGLSGIVGIAMSYSEEIIVRKRKKKDKRTTLERIIENQHICQMNFKENNDDDVNSSQIPRNFVAPDMTSSIESLRLAMPTASVLTSNYKKNNWVSS